MQDFIHRKNIELLERKLAEASTDAERKAIETLLREERAKTPPALGARPSH